MNWKSSFGSMVTTRIKVQNIMSVLVTFGVPVLAAGVIIMFTPAPWFGELLIAADFVGVFSVYIYFMLKDPDRLQSEDFLNEQKRMDLEVTDSVTYETPEAMQESYSEASPPLIQPDTQPLGGN